MTRLLQFGLLAAPLVLPACRTTASHEREAQPALESSELGTMHNVAVCDGLWFGGMPSVDDLDLARRRGVERVIAVCPVSTSELPLRATCSRLGLEWHELGLVEGNPISDEAVVRALELMGESPRPRTLMFCRDGSRSAMLFALHRVVNQGMKVEDALIEARRSGMRPGEAEDYVRDFMRKNDRDSVLAGR
ncbi:MAG: hypothetical protein GY711_28395 [bacterium]|nr:hypothetical protein [bacterium]